MSKDSITKDVHKIKKTYTKEKYMEYATYKELKKEIEELYKEYEEKNTKTNRDYIIRQNRLSEDYLLGIKNLAVAFGVGIVSYSFTKILEAINAVKVEGNSISIDLLSIIGYTILFLVFYYGSIYINKQGVNKYANDIEQYEIDLIDEILKDKYNKSKEINNEEKQ